MVMKILVKWLMERSIPEETVVMVMATTLEAMGGDNMAMTAAASLRGSSPLSLLFLGRGAGVEESLPLLEEAKGEAIS
jgi:hypothetical protein